MRSLFNYLKPPRGFHLTKSGKIFFLFLIAIIIVAMLTGNNLLFLILAGMLSFMIVSGIESERNIRYLEMSRILPSQIFAKRPAVLSYGIRNLRNASSRLVIEDILKLNLGHLAKGITEKLRMEVIFPKRGITNLDRVKISTTYPYGLFRKSISFDLSQDMIVFPEPISCTSPASLGVEGQGKGQAHDSISHVRPYVQGDPLSAIVWKKQHLGLVSRVIEGGSGTSGIVVLLPGGDMERKLSNATFIILELHKAGSSFGLVMNEYFSGIDTGTTHKLDILRKLACASDIKEPFRRDFNGKAHVIYL
ncbi:MAG: hypothetical protein JXM72_01910 [Deltaproteobacteria bacterium]|nr:hypothetical protein [Deltaproteobacteria bacterium]